MEIVIILLLIVLNGILSMSEIALVSARRSRLETEARSGSKPARAALALSGEPDRFLSTVQIGITLIGILTGLYSGEAFAADFAVVIARAEMLAPYAYGIAKTVIVIAVTYLTLIFGELVPKRIGMAMAEKVSKAVARPMKALSLVAAPLVWLLSKSTALVTKAIGLKESENKVTEEEIKAIVREGMDTGEVQAVEHDIVERVFSLGDRDVDSIMTHRSELVWLDTNDSAEEILRKVCADMHDVYPVSDGRPDELAGAAHMKDLFGNIHRPDFRRSSILKPANCLPENQSVYEALEEFKRTNSAYGFIIDEFGDVLGIVTLRDMMEALVGEVPDEDEEAEMVRREDGSWLVDGQCSFYNFLEQFDREELYRDNEYNTLSGLLLDELKHIPSTGETLSWNGFRFEIVDMDGARIDKVLVHYAAPAPDGTLS